jgi:outer membrane protein assembly factor BamB
VKEPCHHASSAVDDFLLAGSGDSNLYAFDASNGIRLWSGTTGSPVLSSPAVSDGTVYAGSEDGSLYAYNLGAASQAPRRPRPGSLHPDLRLRYQNGARG